LVTTRGEAREGSIEQRDDVTRLGITDAVDPDVFVVGEGLIEFVSELEEASDVEGVAPDEEAVGIGAGADMCGGVSDLREGVE